MYSTVFIYCIICALLKSTVQTDDKQCNEFPDFRLMNTKTDYNLVGNITNYDDYNVENCQIIGVWHLSRHGHRYPSGKTIVDINKTLFEIQNMLIQQENLSLCDADKQAINDWKIKMEAKDSHSITPLGRQRLQDLGRRYAKRFANLLSSITPSEIHVQTTYKNRTQDSATEYINGMFESFSDKRPSIKFGGEEDYLLSFYEICNKYLKTVLNNPTACLESDYFENHSKLIKEAIQSLQKTLQINETIMQSNKLFKTVTAACEFEYIIDGTKSAWCKLIDNSHLKVNEHIKDIKYNCESGYKFDIVRLMTCDLVKDLVYRLDDIRKGSISCLFKSKQAKKLNIYFAHSDTVVPLLRTLGLYKDENDFNTELIEELSDKRAWRLSNMDPMMSNIAFILYKCRKQQNTYRLRVFHNEMLVQINGCKSKHCDFNDFQRFYRKFTNECKSSKHSCSFENY